MLPFLKKRHEGGMSEEVNIKRTSDDDASMDMLDAIAEDLIEAVHRKDKALLKGCLEALVEHIQYDDMEQDDEMMDS